MKGCSLYYFVALVLVLAMQVIFLKLPWIPSSNIFIMPLGLCKSASIQLLSSTYIWPFYLFYCMPRFTTVREYFWLGKALASLHLQ